MSIVYKKYLVITSFEIVCCKESVSYNSFSPCFQIQSCNCHVDRPEIRTRRAYRFWQIMGRSERYLLDPCDRDSGIRCDGSCRWCLLRMNKSNKKSLKLCQFGDNEH